MKTQEQVILEPTSLEEITSNLKHLFDPSVWPVLQSSSVVTKEKTPKYVTTPMLRAKAVTGVLSIEPKSGHTSLYSDDIADDQTQKELDEFCKSSFGLYLSYFDEDGNFISSDSILTLFNLGHFFILNGPRQKMNFYKNSCEDSSLFKMLDTEEEFKSIKSLNKDVPDWKDLFQVINFSSMNFEDIFNYSKMSFYKKISQKVGVTLTAFLERLLFNFETKEPNLSEQMCSDIHIFSKTDDYVRKFISHLVPDLLSNLKSTYVFNSEESKQKDLSKIALVSSSTDAFIKGEFWEKQSTSDTSLISYTAKKLLGEKLLIKSPIDRESLIHEMAKMDFVINFDNDNAIQRPSKLIDYAMSRRPILSFNHQTFRSEDFQAFLKGDYSAQYHVDLEQYDIRRVVDQFEELFEEKTGKEVQ